MKYIQVRIEKLKSKAAVSRSAIHNSRDYLNKEKDSPENVDSRRIRQNISFNPKGKKVRNENKEKVMKRLEERLSKVSRKIRPDAVLAVEYVITRTAGDNINDKQLFADSLKFIQDKHGKENVILSTLHKDEKVPHCHFLVVPLVTRENGKISLAAKDFFGKRNALSQLQTDLYTQVGEKHGLQRGVKKRVGERIKNISPKDFRAKEKAYIKKMKSRKPITKAGLSKSYDEFIEASAGLVVSQEIQNDRVEEKIKGNRKETQNEFKDVFKRVTKENTDLSVKNSLLRTDNLQLMHQVESAKKETQTYIDGTAKVFQEVKDLRGVTEGQKSKITRLNHVLDVVEKNITSQQSRKIKNTLDKPQSRDNSIEDDFGY